MRARPYWEEAAALPDHCQRGEGGPPGQDPGRRTRPWPCRAPGATAELAGVGPGWGPGHPNASVCGGRAVVLVLAGRRAFGLTSLTGKPSLFAFSCVHGSSASRFATVKKVNVALPPVYRVFAPLFDASR